MQAINVDTSGLVAGAVADHLDVKNPIDDLKSAIEGGLAVPAAIIRSTQSKVIAPSTITAVDFDDEVLDIGDLYDPATANRINIQTGGLYHFGVSGSWTSAANFVDNRFMFELNDANFIAQHGWNLRASGVFCISFARYLAAGDYLKIKVQQFGGASYTLSDGTRFFVYGVRD